MPLSSISLSKLRAGAAGNQVHSPKRVFVFVETKLLATLGGGVGFLGEGDQFFQPLYRGDGAVVVGVEGLLQLFGKELALHEVLLRAHLQLVLEQLLQQLGGDVLVLEAADFGEELVAED